MSLGIRPLTKFVGAEITGLDLGATLAAATVAELQRAFERYHVLVMRAHPLTEQEQVRFAECFGVVELAREKSVAAERPETMIISNVRHEGKLVGKLPDGEMDWHFDKMRQPVANIAAVLHAVEIPDRGGETSFSDTSLLYASLLEATKARLEGLHVSCAYDYEATSASARVLSDDTPHAVHPLVKTLSDGRKSLFVAPLMVDRIVELPLDESKALLAELYAGLPNPDHIYEHTWQVGDTLIWDNRCCAHRRNDFDPKQRRLLKRVAIGAAGVLAGAH